MGRVEDDHTVLYGNGSKMVAVFFSCFTLKKKNPFPHWNHFPCNCVWQRLLLLCCSPRDSEPRRRIRNLLQHTTIAVTLFPWLHRPVGVGSLQAVGSSFYPQILPAAMYHFKELWNLAVFYSVLSPTTLHSLTILLTPRPQFFASGIMV